MSAGVLLDDSVPTEALYATNLPYATNGDPSNFLVARGALASGDVFYSCNQQNSDSMLSHSAQHHNTHSQIWMQLQHQCNYKLFTQLLQLNTIQC